MNIGDLNLYELVNMVGIPFVEVEETLGYYRIPTVKHYGEKERITVESEDVTYHFMTSDNDNDIVGKIIID